MLAIIQARLSSKRLPFKVLRELNGEPLIMHVLKRVLRSNLVERTIIATSSKKTDDKLTDYLSDKKISFYRGSLENVAERMLGCAKKLGAEEFIRINGDSPLIDPMIIDKAILLNKKDNYDLCTNVLTRTFPKGQSVEIIKTEILNKHIKSFSKTEKEHVTEFFYKNANKFKIKNFQNTRDLSNFQLSVDTKIDFEIINKIICETNEKLGWEDAVKKIMHLK